ncbi:GUN4 domain-containing protein [Leptolyngbya sp. PCC 6406]|uniref:GUN4 domain-containing protein n=1 Tax=Leptolyngbya sp. PCC 6406 TaxID=1173264 RepID=UPI0002AC26D5|nr:GUN4 domain-containing protein [Leptolyngbya sp. PCC 6406]
MSKNWAIIIGINGYVHLKQLNYAVKDADIICSLFDKEFKFHKVYHFTDTSPSIEADYGKSFDSNPTFTNLKLFFDKRFNQPFIDASDNLWFFFAGHGARRNEQDYLIPIDGYSGNLQDTAIPVRYVSDCLRRSGAGNIILLIDACRSSEGSRDSLSIGQEKQHGVITIFACSPEENSYEIEELKQGAFTYALLQCLQLTGQENCATVERLDRQLRLTVPEIVIRYKQRSQTPYTAIEPLYKKDLILLPHLATSTDLTKLSQLAWKAEALHKLEEAKQLWTRVLSASSIEPNVRSDAIEGISRISRNKSQPRADSTKSEFKIETDREQSAPHSVQGINSVNPLETSAPSSKRRHSTSKSLLIQTLESDRGIDYENLSNLLQEQSWQTANQETEYLMLKIARRVCEGWLTHKAIKQFSQTDLENIDRLWRYYSNDRFGFTIQRQIFISVCKQEQEFIAKVAWKGASLHGGLIFSSEATNELQYTIDAPEGHLPFIFCGEHAWIFERLSNS